MAGMPRAGEVDGLFYSTLDTQQTKSHEQAIPTEITGCGWSPGDEFDHRTRGAAYEVEPAHPTETAFRHRSWISNRNRVRKALYECGRPQARLDRFNACGADCIVEISGDGKRTRLRANYCGDRWCEPCQRARARIVTEKLMLAMKGQFCQFSTLTLKHDGKSLKVRRRRLLKMFSNLRRTPYWTSRVTGGAYCVQITRGSKKRHWHVHLHCIHTGKRLHKRGLSDQWKSTTKDSHVVDTQDVQNVERSARYVARYAAKGCEDDVIRDPKALREAVAALAGSRMLGSFGSWRGMEPERECEDTTEWRRVGRLRDIAKAAVAGEPWAIGCLAGLKVTARQNKAGISFDDIKRDREGGSPDG